jgi:hypothetical protein
MYGWEDMRSSTLIKPHSVVQLSVYKLYLQAFLSFMQSSGDPDSFSPRNWLERVCFWVVQELALKVSSLLQWLAREGKKSNAAQLPLMPQE